MTTASPTPFAEGEATGSKMELVQPASAAMPSGEDVARVIYEAQGFAYEGKSVLANGTPYAAWAKCVNGARAVLALFAPILAEKERVERNREMWKGQCERQAETLRELRRQMLADKGQNHER